MPTIWQASTTLEDLLAKMAAHGVAGPDDLRGCSDAEIQALEERYSVRLPSSYRSYLKTMGHRAGRLFDGDHWVASYAEVLRLTHEERGSAARAEANARQLEEILGAHGLIVLERLGEQFYFIRCNESDDPPVRYFENDGWETKLAYPSVLAWLDDTCAEAVGAIRRD